MCRIARTCPLIQSNVTFPAIGLGNGVAPHAPPRGHLAVVSWVELQLDAAQVMGADVAPVARASGFSPTHGCWGGRPAAASVPSSTGAACRPYHSRPTPLNPMLSPSPFDQRHLRSERVSAEAGDLLTGTAWRVRQQAAYRPGWRGSPEDGRPNPEAASVVRLLIGWPPGGRPMAPRPRAFLESLEVPQHPEHGTHR